VKRPANEVSFLSLEFVGDLDRVRELGSVRILGFVVGVPTGGVVVPLIVSFSSDSVGLLGGGFGFAPAYPSDDPFL
jgi:hypothetical protein